MENRIKELRNDRKLTAAQVAKDLDVGVYTYRAWEDGAREPSLSRIVEIADYFGVTVDYLLYHETAQDYAFSTYASSGKQEIRMSPYLKQHPIYSSEYGWVLIDRKGTSGVNAEGKKIDIQKLGQLYSYAPNDIPGLLSYAEPIAYEDLPNISGSVWVEPISEDPKLNETLKGWYTVKDRYVTNDFGFRFYFASYNNQWIAFTDKQP